jgi:CxxC motif-containing protein
MADSSINSKPSESKKVIRCIICPTGCEITTENVNGELKITGFGCKRGEEYAKEEAVAPKRIITTTMRVENGFLPIIPVRTEKPIPKESVFSIIKEISCIRAKAPIKVGDILIENIHNLGVNVIASRNMPAKV